ncbi:uncharacterized protein LOC104884975 [Beta vulgaris subsp. vulgaris]|uniref:uncharacterized protein LOC104884975 n=1 Tax=Beta vulgaris subsp. vulgaris TaxID=3555 RepID=UPI002037499A|nr:uncharacterized protein LOC104884975 [Beta vulgaris subsp. vulgaris]
MEAFINAQSRKNNELEEGYKQLQTHNKMMETQITQLVSTLKEKSSTSLPSQGIDPREHANAIVTRSGKSLGEVQVEEVGKSSETLSPQIVKDHDDELDEHDKSQQVAMENENQPKNEDVLRKLYVNIPFTDAIKQMPTYAKFLKDILSNRRNVDFVEMINIPETCSAIIQNKLPTKLKDPGSFSIPGAINDLIIDRALCDLGASINLKPLSMCKRLNLGELKPTNISLQLADRSVKMPMGKL